jgi:hypothetical protein
MVTPIRLGFRRLRFELLVLLAASLLLSALTAMLALAIAHDNQALGACAAGVDCSSISQALGMWMSWVPYARAALVVLPVLAGVVIGTSLVASEVERGTAAFAWSVILRRRTWLADCCIIGLFGLAVVAIPLAAASAGLSAALGMQADSTSAPSGIDTAPLLLLARPLVAFAIAAAVGMLAGRSLPTLLVTGLASLLVLGGLELAFAAWRDGAAEPVDLSAPGAYYVSDAAIAADGGLVSVADALATAEALGKPPDELYRFVHLGLTPETRARMLAAEAGLTVVLSGAGLVAVGLLAEHRRPG